ncbi:MAG TPA: hypothetical protein VHP31_07155 [Caproicibacter sp.]|nr:hypothetical protein [Caproicibacter sp.]
MAELSEVFPCGVGDTVFSFEWDTKGSKYVIIEQKCIGFNVRANEGYDILLKGEKFEYFRKSVQYKVNWFTSLEEAKTKLESLNRH